MNEEHYFIGYAVFQVPKVTAEEWKNMTEEQKMPYEEVFDLKFHSLFGHELQSLLVA